MPVGCYGEIPRLWPLTDWVWPSITHRPFGRFQSEAVFWMTTQGIDEVPQLADSTISSAFRKTAGRFLANNQTPINSQGVWHGILRA